MTPIEHGLIGALLTVIAVAAIRPSWTGAVVMAILLGILVGFL